MKTNKRLAIFLLTFVMILSFIPTVSVQAATKEIKIISDTEVTAKEARKWAKSRGATETFQDLAELYFEYSSDCGDVNPAIAYVQAAKETGYGKFGGVLDASYHNPCGLKTAQGGDNYDPKAHQIFDSWDKGVQAHLDHLALYAGADEYPKNDSYDPRHFRTLKGKAETVSELGGKWAPSSTYGEEIVDLYKDLLDYAGVEEDWNDDEDYDDEDKDYDDEDSSVTPNPGTPENKPSLPNIKDIVKDIKPEVIDKTQDNNPNITSKIGWKNQNGAWYYYRSDNTKATGWIKPDSNWYYLKKDGRMATGWFVTGGKWYYLKDSGVMVKGWIKLKDSWYYLKNSGEMATGFINDGSALYYLKTSGEMVTNNGWTSLNGKWYYCEKSGRVKTGWLRDGSSWYYLQDDGSMVTGFNKIDNKHYLFNDSGSMKTGWSKINNYWYYFNTDGSMTTGFIRDNETNYYLYDTGAMAKGWINLNGAWYYLKDTGAMVKGWISSGSDWYYLEPSTGRMLTDTTIDGYRIGFDGKRKKESDEDDRHDKDRPNTPNNPDGKTIVVDAGHNYGGDYGAEKTIDGVTYSETVLNMQVASRVKVELEKRGYNIIMTRTEDEKELLGLKQSLTDRVNKANNANADFFISIHHNSAIETAKGVETYYSSNPQDDEFADNARDDKLSISKRLAASINNKIANKLSLNNRGAKNKSLFVCRNTNMPAVLVEVGFITNKEEAERCADPQSQQLVAEAIAEAIAENI